MSLTKKQLDAINEVNSHLQIIACAGSGKTDVVSRRIAQIISKNLAKPEEVVAFTFTEKAAAELKERIYRYVNQEIGTTEGLAGLYIGTIHGYCLELLQTHVPELFKFRVLPEIQNRLLVNRYSTQSGLTVCPTSSIGTPFLKRGRNTGLYINALSVFREDEVDHDQIPTGFKNAHDQYVNLLQKQSWMDFTDVLVRAVEAIENCASDDSLMSLRQTLKNYKYITVDEYQDVNPIQEKLVSSIISHGAKLCVVGDDDQTIYQWRGSEVTNILTFAHRYSNVTSVVLDDNFRSSKGVVDLATIVANDIDPSVRLPKQMNAAGHQKYERGDILALELTDPHDEARWIARKIKSMIGLPFRDKSDGSERGLTWSDFAVLFRSVRTDSGTLVDIFKEEKIPFIIKGLARLFEIDEVVAIQAAFRYAAKEIDLTQFKALWRIGNLCDSKSFDNGLKFIEEVWEIFESDKYEKLNLQQFYLDMLAAFGITEEKVPNNRGSIAFYSLGKFSEVISDFESINYQLSPDQKLTAFTRWLTYEAREVYEEAYGEIGYAIPDAVVISTVHQAKGMQWPSVFIPMLQRSRFPMPRRGGLRLDHVLPSTAINNFDRYLGNLDDERRLFYVALTRAQKFLFLTWAPGATNSRTQPSEFFTLARSSSYVLTKDIDLNPKKKIESTKRNEVPDMTLTFSELKYLFDCPYQFKLRFLYGFDSPINEALGFGKGLHDVLSEIHKRAINGEIVKDSEIPNLVERHLWIPFANDQLRKNLKAAAAKAVEKYLKEHGSVLDKTLHSEKRIQVHISDGIVVDGRIDLIRRLETDEISIVDFKSTERAQAEDVTLEQLNVYALGYKELTGKNPDILEILNLDAKGKVLRTMVSEVDMEKTRKNIEKSGEQIRKGDLKKHAKWCASCDACDFVQICRKREKTKVN